MHHTTGVQNSHNLTPYPYPVLLYDQTYTITPAAGSVESWHFFILLADRLNGIYFI
jgi:hypothetical protein